MNAYSLDFRKAVLSYVDEGKLQAVPIPRGPHKFMHSIAQNFL